RVVEMITKGPFKTIFWGSGVVLGTLLPLVLLLFATSPFALAGASLLSLIGLWYLIRLWVQVPQLLSLS
ncbi:MAG: 4Fe-4S ferredoxin, partial [SAR324 cluster bacterium]|nr:4Fe-4S ferredoxin [SAR324 cluster bacterium]